MWPSSLLDGVVDPGSNLAVYRSLIEQFTRELFDAGVYSYGTGPATGRAALLNMVGRGGWPPARTYDPDLLSYAWAARKGPAILSMGIGATGTFYQYDISRAYSAALRECQTTDPCFTKWERVVAPRWADLRGNDVAYVFARIGVTLPPDFPIPACPLKIVHRRVPLDSGIAWLYGEHSMFVTKPDMALLDTLGIPFTIRSAWVGRIGIPWQPFRAAVDRLLGIPAYGKVLLNAAIGQFASLYESKNPTTSATRRTVPNTFNPILHAHIMAQVRATILQAAMAVPRGALLGVHTDGLQTTVQLPYPTDAPPGQLRAEGRRDSGMYVTPIHRDNAGRDVLSYYDRVRATHGSARGITLDYAYYAGPGHPRHGTLLETRMEIPYSPIFSHLRGRQPTSNDLLRGWIPSTFGAGTAPRFSLPRAAARLLAG